MNASERPGIMLRHTIATLAYRAGKVLRGAPADFSGFTPAAGSRSAGRILAHMGDLMDWALSIAEGKQAWYDSAPQAWDADVHRFFTALVRFDVALAERDPKGGSEEQLFQGPIADALTHVGQLAMLRRMAGAPVKGENYFVAEIVTGRVGPEQVSPKKEF